MTINFEIHMIICKIEKWNISLLDQSGHVRIKRKSEKTYNFTYEECFSLLRRDYPGCINHSTKQALHKISEACKICNEHSIHLFRFRESTPEENVVFNIEIGLDIMCLHGKLVLYIVAIESNYLTATFINGKLCTDIWNYFIYCWSSI